MQNVKWLIGMMTIGLMIGLPAISQAIPGTRVLITDNPNHKVIEVDPVTNNVVWEYGGPGILNYPNEAIPLTNGNILIADTYNGRVIEVAATPTVTVWTYSTGLSRPVDIKMCTNYTGGTPTSTLLITDFGTNKVIEVTYPGGEIVREILGSYFGGSNYYVFWEAEKQPGMGTPTYLLTCRSNYGRDSVLKVSSSTTTFIVTWRYGYDPNNPTQLSSLNDPRDANWTPCGNVLITDTDNKRVIEVQPLGSVGGLVVWGKQLSKYPYEAIRIENGSTLVAAGSGDDNKDGKYVGTASVSPVIWEFRPDLICEWQYTSGTSTFVDIEEKGIINIAKIEYKDVDGNKMPKVFAGVVVPIFQPTVSWVGSPTIVAIKTVSPQGPQKPLTTLTYTIELRNTGNGTATAVVVTDQVPDGTKYVFDSDAPEADEFSHDGRASWDNAETVSPITHLRWNLGVLGPNETRTLTFSVVIQP